MKKKILLALIIAGLCFIPLFAGGQQEIESVDPSPDTGEILSDVEAPPETVTVIDGYGREVTLELPIKTVVSGALSATEAMTILDVQDRMISIDWVASEYPTLYGDLTNLPVVSSSDWYNPNLEKIYELNPDLFITLEGPMEGFAEMVSRLEPEIPVIALPFGSPEEAVGAVEMLGKIFQCEQAAEEYVDFYQGTLDLIKERTADIPEEEKVRVFYEGGAPYFTMSKGFLTWHNHIAIPGGLNVAADMQQPFGPIDPEFVIGCNPEVIISMAISYPFMDFDAVDCGYDVDDSSSIESYYESILSRSELSVVSAVKESRVHVINSELPITSVIGFSYFAKWFYPDRFKDFDPQAIHQEYLDRFMRIDYDLDKRGVFVYPEL